MPPQTPNPRLATSTAQWAAEDRVAGRFLIRHSWPGLAVRLEALLHLDVVVGVVFRRRVNGLVRLARPGRDPK
jgi:hypothetical protein